MSDRTHSLQLALQMTWIGVLISGLWWGAAFYFLPPLPISLEISKSACVVPTATVQKATYCSLFLMKDADGSRMIERENNNLVLDRDDAL